MSDLPNTQPPIYNDEDQNESDSDKKKVKEPQNISSIKPGVPFSEARGPETTPTPEIRKSPETMKAPENIPIPKPNSSDEKNKKTEKISTSPKKSEKVKNVVDKTDQITSLHEVDAKDKLTREADDEEEHFIEEVEKHHGRL